MVSNIAEFPKTNVEIERLKRIFQLQKQAALKKPYPDLATRKDQLKRGSFRRTCGNVTQLVRALHL